MDRAFLDAYELGALHTGQAIKGLIPEDLLAFPVPGTWSIQQVVLHLADSEQVFADRMKRLIADETPLLQAYDENRWTQHLHYAEQSAADAAALIELTRKQMAKVLKALPDDAFGRSGTHSVAGPVTLRQVVEKANTHLEHHLKFVTDKREKLGKLLW